MRRHEPPPTSRAESATLRISRAPRSGRARIRSSSACEGAAEGELVPDRLGELEPLGDLRRRRPRLHSRVPLVPRQAPGAPAVRPQSFGDGATRQPGKLSDLLDPEVLQLLAPLSLHREERQRERREELLGAVVVDDQGLPRPGDRGGGERGEAAVGRACAGVPAGPDRGAARASAPARRRRRAARPHASRSRGTRARRARSRSRGPRDCRITALPRRLDPGRVPLDEDELRAGGERLAEAHAGTHPARLGGGSDGAEQRLGPGQRRERRRLQPHARATVTQRRLEFEPWDEDASDHGNVCSTRTHVLLSRRGQSPRGRALWSHTTIPLRGQPTGPIPDEGRPGQIRAYLVVRFGRARRLTVDAGAMTAGSLRDRVDNAAADRPTARADSHHDRCCLACPDDDVLGAAGAMEEVPGSVDAPAPRRSARTPRPARGIPPERSRGGTCPSPDRVRER